jgi:hypothetical protein
MGKYNSEKHANTSKSAWGAENHNNCSNYINPMFWWWILKGR